MAAETPHTLVAQATIIANFLLTIFRTRPAKANMKITTVGVTIHATINPGAPRETIFLNNISAPRRTSPVFMNISVLAPASNHLGVPMVLEISKPTRSAHKA